MPAGLPPRPRFIFLIDVGCVIAWRRSHLAEVDVDRAWDEAHNRMVAPPGGDVLADHFRRLGYDGPFPQNLNYSRLTYYGLGEFEGRPVPQLIFLSPHGDHAEVRVLSAKQFNFKTLPTDFQSPDGLSLQDRSLMDPRRAVLGRLHRRVRELGPRVVGRATRVAAN